MHTAANKALKKSELKLNIHFNESQDDDFRLKIYISFRIPNPFSALIIIVILNSIFNSYSRLFFFSKNKIKLHAIEDDEK